MALRFGNEIDGYSNQGYNLLPEPGVTVLEPLTDVQLAENFEMFKKELGMDRTAPYQKAFNAMIDVYGDDLDKFAKLQKIGFKKSEFMESMQDVIEWFSGPGQEAEDREYYLVHYPGYKFFTKTELDSLCEKYNLIWGQVSQYNDKIPDKCVEEMINLTIKEEDQSGDSTMQIIAPEEKFDLGTQYKVEGHRVVMIPKEDPLALRPVRGGYLLASAWGEESYLEEVINPQRN